MAFQEKQLGQIKVTATGAGTSVYSPAAGVTAVIKEIVFANVGGASVGFSLFLDDDGTTYDLNTCIASAVNLQANDFRQISGFFPMNASDGNLAVDGLASGGAAVSGLCVTIFGAEIS